MTPFRELQRKWDEHLEKEKKKNIETLLDGNHFVMFFKKDNAIYASGEDGRVAFARMKNPDEDSPKDWAKEATFSAIDLNQALIGQRSKHIFTHLDVKTIDIIDHKEALKQLIKAAEKIANSDKKLKVVLDLDAEQEEDETPPNMTHLKDKE